MLARGHFADVCLLFVCDFFSLCYLFCCICSRASAIICKWFTGPKKATHKSQCSFCPCSCKPVINCHILIRKDAIIKKCFLSPHSPKHVGNVAFALSTVCVPGIKRAYNQDTLDLLPEFHHYLVGIPLCVIMENVSSQAADGGSKG